MSVSMDLDLLKAFGQIAAPAGIAIGTFLYIARDVIAKNIFPTLTRGHAYNVIVVLAFMAWSVALAGIASWTYVSTHTQNLSPTHAQLPALPGDTGWIFAGYVNIERESFVEGPYVSVQSTTRQSSRHFIEIGDTVALKVARDVHIVDFKKTGVSQKLVSPITKGIIDEYDKTGITLPSGAELVVRDVSKGQWPDNPNAALWLRIVYVPK